MKKNSSGLLSFILKRLWFYNLVILEIFILVIAAAVLTSQAPRVVGVIVDEILVEADVQRMEKYVLLLAGFLIAGNLCGAARQYLVSRATDRFTRDLSRDVFGRLIHTDYSFFSETQQGDILQKVTRDIKTLQNFEIDSIPNFCYEIVLAVFAMIFVLRLYWPLGVLGLAIYFVYLIPTHLMARRIKAKVKLLRDQAAHLKQVLLEKLGDIDQIKVYGTEEKEYEEVCREQEKWAQLLQEKYLVDQASRTFPRVLDALIPALVFLIGGWQYLKGNLTIGSLVAITAYLPYVNAPIKSYSKILISIKEIGAQLESTAEYLALEEETGFSDTMRHVDALQGGIEFRNVSVVNERGAILDSVSFKVHPGEHVALVGATGSGKSTVLKLIIRLIEPSSGEIYLDGQPLKKLNAADVRRRIGNILQDTFIFCDTLDANLFYPGDAKLSAQRNVEFSRLENANPVTGGNPRLSGPKAVKPESEKDSLLTRVGMDDVIRRFPAENQEVLGKSGTALSGGQKQRLGIVRALLGDHDMLLMDEATSALDSASEEAVDELLWEKTEQKTCIYSAHRLETVVNADRILVMRAGKLVESGTHEELLAQKGYYSRLWGEQAV